MCNDNMGQTPVADTAYDTIRYEVDSLDRMTFIMQKEEKKENALIGYHVFSWLQFALIAFLISIIYFILRRFHLFRLQVREKSIGYRMFIYLLLVILVVSFLLVRPVIHILFLIVLFGLFYKNIVSYTRSLFSLYYSGVRFGDKVRIGDVAGRLENMNFGGLHITTADNKVYFPFNMWKNDKIIVESESGNILFSFVCRDSVEGRSEMQGLHDLEKSIFNYPYLESSDIDIEKLTDEIKVALKISDVKYKSGLLKHIEKAGFRLNLTNT